MNVDDLLALDMEYRLTIAHRIRCRAVVALIFLGTAAAMRVLGVT